MKNDYRETRIFGVKEIHKLERFIEEICDYYNINNEYFGNVLLATTEAANILLAVTERQEMGLVLVRFERNPKGLTFKIRLEDKLEGSEETEDVLDKEIRKHRLSKEIFIVKALTDEITISLSGKSITLTFYISSMNYEKSLYRINQLKEYWNKNVTIHTSESEKK